MTMKVAQVAVMCLGLALATAPRPYAQEEPLAAARQLYASAEYEDALRLLDTLAVGKYTREERQTIDLYRALCLLAVGRHADADRTIEAMIALDPLYRPAGDLSPRMRTAFSDARKRVLPAIVQQRYSEARAAFDRKDFVAAASLFRRVVDALGDPDMAQAAAQPPLADLRTLAAGFHDLSVKATPPPPAPSPVEPPPVPAPPRVYTGEEINVAPPVAIRQNLPKFPGRVRPGGITGVVEVVINEAGAVESAVMVVPMAPAYDKLVLTGASNWMYRPASVNGTPVKFRKRIQISISEP